MGPLGELLGARVELAAGRRDRGGHGPDLADDLGELVDHRVDQARQVAQLVVPVDVRAVVEVALVESSVTSLISSSGRMNQRPKRKPRTSVSDERRPRGCQGPESGCCRSSRRRRLTGTTIRTHVTVRPPGSPVAAAGIGAKPTSSADSYRRPGWRRSPRYRPCSSALSASSLILAGRSRCPGVVLELVVLAALDDRTVSSGRRRRPSWRVDSRSTVSELALRASSMSSSDQLHLSGPAKAIPSAACRSWSQLVVLLDQQSDVVADGRGGLPDDQLLLALNPRSTL